MISAYSTDGKTDALGGQGSRLEITQLVDGVVNLTPGIIRCISSQTDRMIVLLELLQLITHEGGWVKIARDVFSKQGCPQQAFEMRAFRRSMYGNRPVSVCSCDPV